MVDDACNELGIDETALAARGLCRHEQAVELVFVETGAEGRDHFLVQQAADSWHAMKAEAREAGLTLVIASSFRSIDRQAAIIRGKRECGQSLEQVLHAVAPPGYSEHHTGRAVDIVSPDHPDLEDSFEATREFAWLAENAQRFGFALSYPRGNAAGYVYEPWHWCFHPHVAQPSTD